MFGCLAGFATALVCYGLLDLLWVGVAANAIYRGSLGHLMSDSVRWGAVAVFYPLYASGVLYFAVRPGIQAGSVATAARHGAGLGLVVYGTYNLTNLALLQGWTVGITVMDIAWGTFVTALVASAACAVRRAIG
jgi:uncharacterized membrane protein